MEQRKMRITDILSIVLSVITLFTVISAGFFWYYKTDELPKRVDETEIRLDKLEM